MRHPILISLFVLLALPAWADIPTETPLETGFIARPVLLLRNGHTFRLMPLTSLEEGDIVRTGDSASAQIHFVQNGLIKLGSFTQIFIHSASTGSLGRGPILRLQLLLGDLTLEAYPSANTVPQDYRINVGAMQIRGLGADLWVYANSDGEVVCLHKGAIEISGSIGEQRLDIVGQCLQHGKGGQLQVLQDVEAALKYRLLPAKKIAADATKASEPADASSVNQDASTSTIAPKKSGIAAGH